MELVTIRQMQAADAYAIQEAGIPEKLLMKNAADALVEAIRRHFDLSKSKTVVFCGPGNNGGDGWAASVVLHDEGSDVKIVTKLVPEPKSTPGHFSGKAFEKGIPVCDGVGMDELADCDFIIDAIFGIGLSRELSGDYIDFIQAINDSDCFVFSADVPSGIHSDEGVPFPIAVRADETVCFGRPKVSLFSEPGFGYAGNVKSHDIGIPSYSYSETDHFTNDGIFARKIYRRRSRTGFKGNYGKILIIAGSPGMTGAASLCADACFRSGAGLVYNIVPKSKKYEYEALVREAISISVNDGGQEYVSSISADDIVRAALGKTAVVMGPGLHEKSRSHEIFEALAKGTALPIIVDARTLNDLSEKPELLELAEKRIIITPHPGEMAAITGISTDEIQKNRIGISREFAKQYGVIVLLKGHRTVITDGSRVMLNTTGNPGMATAGSGDVLCGVIAAALSYAPSLLEAAAAGAYIHGLAGDSAAERLGEYSMKSGDIIDELPGILKKVTEEI